MKAFMINDFVQGPALRDIARPEPRAHEILVRIHAAALNFADLLVCKGTYQDLPDLPATLGFECAGIVEAIGSDVTQRQIGDRVAIYAGQGGLAEYGTFDAASAIPIPDAMPFEDAAAFQIAYGTSHLALAHRGRLQAGETLVVLGAAGGVGLTAVEIGAHMGARVVAVARGADKLKIAQAAGAHVLLDSESVDLKSALRDLGRADVVYDAVGGDQFTAALGAMRPGGRILAIGFASGTVPQIPANHLLVKNVDVVGVYWGGYLSFAPDILRDSLKTLLTWYADGKIRPHISETFPLDHADEALEYLRSRRATGKIVVTP
jgi:NADPH2:quinone reductase